MAIIRDRKDTKVQTVCQKLRELAFRKGPEAKLPTTRELCRELDTSSATLIAALNELELQNVVYRKDRSGIYVSNKLHHKSFALAMGSTIFGSSRRSPFWDVLWRLFIEEAERRTKLRGETLTFHVVNNDDAEYPVDDHLARMISGGMVDGVLGVGLDERALAWFEEFDIPTVSFAGKGTYHVLLDHELMIRMSVQCLAGAACKRVWFMKRSNAYLRDFSPDYTRETHRTWDEYFLDEAARCGMLLGSEQIVEYGSDTDDHTSFPEQGRFLASRLVDNGRLAPGDGLLITDDMLALGALRELQTRGLLPQLKVVSHGNKDLPVLYAFEPYITRVEFDPSAIVSRMFALMDRVLAGVRLEENIEVVVPALI